MSLSTSRSVGTATPVASVSPVASAFANSASPDKTTDSMTIVVSIICAVLALASVVIAILQYRIQAQRKPDVERDGQPIEMNPRPPQEGVPPRPSGSTEPPIARRGTM